MPGLVAKHHNPVIVAMAKRLASRGMAPKAVVGASMWRLVHLIYGVINSGKHFDIEIPMRGLVFQDGICPPPILKGTGSWKPPRDRGPMANDQEHPGSGPLFEFDLKDDGTASLRITPAGELDAERRAEISHSANPANWPKDRRKTWEAMQRVSARGAAAYAVADHFIRDNVLTVVVRDPCPSSMQAGTEPIRMVIVPADARDDTSACLGEATLRQDEMAVFNAPARRVLTMFVDRRVRLDTTDDAGAASIMWRQSTTKLYNIANSTMSRVRRLTAEVEAEEMAGIGTIRVAPPPGSAAWSAWERWIDSCNAELGRAPADVVEAEPSLIQRARKGMLRSIGIAPASERDGVQRLEQILAGETRGDVLTAVLRALRDPTEEAQLLRRVSPFAGMVPLERREAILREYEKL
jgi:hypothetical protein